MWGSGKTVLPESNGFLFSPKISSTFIANFKEAGKYCSEVSEIESEASDDDDVRKRETELESICDEDYRTRDTETELCDEDEKSSGSGSQFKDLLLKCELNDLKAAVLEREMVSKLFEGVEASN